MEYLGTESPAEFINMAILLVQMIFLWAFLMYKMGTAGNEKQ
jgi:uncharacterized membrane protein required for colicin V production